MLQLMSVKYAENSLAVKGHVCSLWLLIVMLSIDSFSENAMVGDYGVFVTWHDVPFISAHDGVNGDGNGPMKQCNVH